MTKRSLAPELIRSAVANGQPASKLLVLVHGYFKTAESLRPLIEVLRHDPALSEYDFLLLPYAVGRLRNANPDALALGLNSTITNELHDNSNYITISLLGHSLGGLLVRHMYLIAKGVIKPDDITVAQPWAEKVESLVLVASPNRGLSLQRWGWAGRLFIRLAARLGMAKLIYSALPGSEFITNLRLEWMEEMHRLGDAAPKVVQVLGTRDNDVLREDSIDVVQFKNACHLFVPNENHNSIIDVHPGDQKYEFLRDAIITGEWLKKASVESPEGMDNGMATSEPASAVVFLVHGIRDYGTWMEPLAKMIDQRDAQIKPIKPSYDYFSLLQFVLTPLRRSKVAWFRDEYTQVRATYPGVPIHYIGHSNGTYILANTLKNFRSVRVERVYFAGSVLPRDFDWQALFARGQLKMLRNDCAAADWPVGVICAGLCLIMPRELGIAGYQGFTFGDGTLVRQLRHIAGGHGAAMDGSDKQASIADFITGRQDADPPLTEPTQWFDKVNKFAPFLFVFAVMLLLAFLWLLLSMALWGGLVGLVGALVGLVVLLFLGLRI